MAKSNNLPAKMYKAGERTERTLRFSFDCGSGGSMTTKYIDIGMCLSMLNARAYRSGLYYYIQNITFSNNSEAYCQINTCPDTHAVKRAWIRGFRKWQKMNNQALNGSGASVLPKYHDFKVAMVPAGTTLEAPVRGDIASTTAITVDEWKQSEFVTADPPGTDPQATDTFAVHMLGPHSGSAGSWTSIGLVHSLNDSRRMQASSAPVLVGDFDTDPLANLFDAGDNLDDVRLNLDEDNDEAPYNYDAYYGATSADETVVGAILRTGTGAGALSHAPGFCVPFGLLEVNVSDFGAGTDIGQVELIIEIAPGPYHGVFAERAL